MKNFVKKVGEFFKTNYWLPPLLLVAVVFIVVFSLEGIENVVDDVKGWFDPNSNCSQCEKVTVNKAYDVLENSENGSKVYVYYYDKASDSNRDNTYTANEGLNRFIKSYKKDNGKKSITVYAVNYGIDETNAVTGDITEWKDSKMTQEYYDQISEEVRLYYKDSQVPSVVSGYGVNGYTITAPVLVEYTVDANGYKVTNVLRQANNFNQATLKTFFNGTYVETAE